MESKFRERILASSIQLLEGQTWDVLACADVALAASGTVTIEAAVLGTPMVTFYRVNNLSWWMGRRLVNVPFYSMVNLVAGRRVVEELIQDDFTAARLSQQAVNLLQDAEARERMRQDLASCRPASCPRPKDPLELAASLIEERWEKEEMVHV